MVSSKDLNNLLPDKKSEKFNPHNPEDLKIIGLEPKLILEDLFDKKTKDEIMKIVEPKNSSNYTLSDLKAKIFQNDGIDSEVLKDLFKKIFFTMVISSESAGDIEIEKYIKNSAKIIHTNRYLIRALSPYEEGLDKEKIEELIGICEKIINDEIDVHDLKIQTIRDIENLRIQSTSAIVAKLDELNRVDVNKIIMNKMVYNPLNNKVKVYLPFYYYKSGVIGKRTEVVEFRINESYKDLTKKLKQLGFVPVINEDDMRKISIAAYSSAQIETEMDVYPEDEQAFQTLINTTKGVAIEDKVKTIDGEEVEVIAIPSSFIVDAFKNVFGVKRYSSIYSKLNQRYEGLIVKTDKEIRYYGRRCVLLRKDIFEKIKKKLEESTVKGKHYEMIGGEDVFTDIEETDEMIRGDE